MAGAVVSSAANWIGTQLVDELNFLLDVEDQVRSLQLELEYIALYLIEADFGGEVGDGQLSLFTKELRAIAFRAEDVVDNYILKVASSSSPNIDGNFLKKFLCFSQSNPDIHSIGREIAAIRSSIQKAVGRLEQFRNARLIATREGFNQPRPHRNTIQTYPHTEDAYVVGRRRDVADLVQQLTCRMDTRVVAIVGAGGIGKTTLARKIYTDIRIQNHFKAAAWVTISQQWNQKDLLFEILRQTKGIGREERNSIKDWSEQEFVEAIHGFLSQRSYLLVLDDMWEREAWNCIYPAVSSKAFGSKVIITTRKEDLPSQLMDQNCIIHRPQFLTEEQSWQLFQKIALEKKDTEDIIDDDVVQLGRQMTQKCGGLPLGVVTLAGLLRTKDTSEWEGMSRRFNSILLNVQGPPQYGRSVYQTLTLSYYDLPHYLKPCFLYLALFPEDFVISAKMLTRMWVAEGFVMTKHVESAQVNEPVEDVAEQFLNELIQRCVVQVVAKSFTTGKAKKFRVHDLTRDFCIAKAEEQCFINVVPLTNQSNITASISTQPRRISILKSGTFLPTRHSHVRSFIQFGVKGSTLVSLEAPYKNLKLLRVLILYQVKFHDGYLPEEFGNLRHLRYMALIETNLQIIPDSIGNLSNLLHLECRTWSVEMMTLPNVLWKMKSLRHLCLSARIKLPEGCKLHNLTNLQTLQTINGEEYWKLEAEMERLSPSIKMLRIANIGSDGMLDALFRSPCMTSGNLENLCLDWKDGVELKDMEPLYKHCQHLRKLRLKNKIGEDCRLQFPPSLVKLHLYGSKQKLHDPMVAAGGLGHLKYLWIGENAYRGVEMTCNAGSFPQLEELSMDSLDNLEEWRVGDGAMPRLNKLHVSGCRRLKRLPEKLKSIRCLRQLEIEFMPRTFCHRLFRQGEQQSYGYRAGAADGGVGGEDFHIIQHVSYVSFVIDDEKTYDDEYFALSLSLTPIHPSTGRQPLPPFL